MTCSDFYDIQKKTTGLSIYRIFNEVCITWPVFYKYDGYFYGVTICTIAKISPLYYAQISYQLHDLWPICSPFTFIGTKYNFSFALKTVVIALSDIATELNILIFGNSIPNIFICLKFVRQEWCCSFRENRQPKNAMRKNTI